MTDHDRLTRLFRECSDLPPDARRAHLESACPGEPEVVDEVLSLFAHEDSGGVERVAEAAAADLRDLTPSADAVPAADLPASIGTYRILGLVGAGGMGVVYEAEQEAPRRPVALKVIRPGLATPSLVRRFEHEAEVLGWLDHPGIARIFDAGTADTGHGPQPYFAMELVEGEPLHRYAAAHGLDDRARLELVARVADAVHHAHQKGVVHRDLKPANVLVDAAGQPKVLDFGVARVTDADLKAGTLLTGAGELVGTLPYMSPEQVGGDPAAVDARSDVYALGAMLYELLSGQLPHDVAGVPLPEAARRIAQDEPTTLGALDRRLRGDVEVIVAKALEADPARRYGSAEELAADLRRHLADEVIVARRPSGAYQLRKFARRNRGLVAAAGLLFLSMVAGTVVSTWQFLDARAGWEAERVQRGEAQEQAAAAELAAAEARENLVAAERVTDFLVSLFEVSDPDDDWGQELTARELLDQGAADLAAGLADQPRTAALLLRTMGRVYRNLGAFDAAEPLLADALDLDRGRAEAGEPSTAEPLATSLWQVAALERQRGRYEASEALLDEALVVAEDLDEGHPLLPRLLNARCNARYERGDYAGATKDVERALALFAAALGPDHLQAAGARLNRAQILAKQGDSDAGLAEARAVLAQREAALPAGDPDLVRTRSAVAVMHFTREEFPEALALIRTIHDTRLEKLGPDHPAVLDSVNDLAVTLHELGQLDEAERLHRRSLEGRRARYGDDNPRVAIALHNLARLEEDLGRYADSELHYDEALAIRTAAFGELHLDVAKTMGALGAMLSRGPRRPDDAIPLLERALELHLELEATGRVRPGPGASLDLARAQSSLANARLAVGDLDLALEAFEDLLATYEAAGRRTSVAQTLHALSILYVRAKDLDAALGWADRCREVQDEILPPGHPDRSFNLDVVGRCLVELERFDEALEPLTDSLTFREAAFGAGHPRTAETLLLTGRALAGLDRQAEAEPSFLAAVEIAEATYPVGHPERVLLHQAVIEFYGGWGREAERAAFEARLGAERNEP